MKNFLIGATSVFLILTACSCQKTNSGNANSGNGQDTSKPQPTAVGTPISNAISKVIGAGGGTITSADGSVELNIPPGALPGDTTITMQPITNNCPGGILSAYRFSPGGLKFKLPSTLKIHYPDSALKGTIAQLMGMAVQDSNGYWRTTTKFTNDTIAHTLAASIIHFTDYSLLEFVQLVPGYKAVKAGGKVNFTIKLVLPKDDNKPVINGDDFTKILYYNSLENNQKIDWAVNGIQNGNDEYGHLTFPLGSGEIIYTAPNKVPSRNNPVAVSAAINLSLTYNNEIYNKIVVYSYVMISDVSYHVTIYFQTEVNESGTYWHWTDTGRFDVLMAGNVGAIENIKNGGATIVLDSGNTTCSVSLVPPVNPIAPIFILDSGEVIYNPLDSSITIIFAATDPKNYKPGPVWKYDCGGGNTGQLGAGTGPPFPAFLQFTTSSDVLQTIILTPQYKMEVALIE